MTGRPEVFCEPCILGKQIRISFKTPFKNQKGDMFKTLCTDCGTEFVNSVVHERSVPYCPEQSGRMEREMHTIGDTARTMMTVKGLEKSFLAEAANTALCVINRTGTSTVEGKIPYQLWEGKDYDITLLKVFRSEASVHSADQTHKKWDVKSKKGIFVGYSETSKGFRVFLPRENKVIVSCNVKFTQKMDSEEALQRSIGYPCNLEKDSEKEDFLGFPNLNEGGSNVNTARPSVLTQEENEAGNIEPEEYELVSGV
ncbi:hypothetical protein PR048_002351 [Dryococelus australis]|uniref:Retroviral polymerase SH3-like domain-containing protein n=1 Tax=Dryococelus australis TaxID=614101 RepID=A0ABQ9IJW6_9NEOP|nr:hypothetical protein PR048_002351 [Dryococelus australis]